MSRARHLRSLLPAIVIALAGLLAYANSLQGAFLLDDSKHIVNNPRIQSLWPLWETVTPPPNEGRPVVALTLAVNYAMSGLNTWSYHAFNVAVHVLAALVLFGIVRRSLTELAPGISDGPRQTLPDSEARTVALASALIFVVHPLQTESVTYIIQRSESLAGLLYLSTIYAVLRSAAPEARTGWWQALAVAACAAGMGTKQVMVTAPVVTLLYDRSFLSGGFVEALRARWRLYLALASTWGILALLQWISPNPGAGFGREVGPGEYLATQSGVVLHYLRLSIWPVGLCFDYAWPVATTAGEILLPSLAVLTLLAATVWALVYRPEAGFCGAGFFLALAPSSSILPISQLAAEHRMYLSLAAVIVLAVTAIMVLARSAPRAARPAAMAALGLAVAAGGILTHRRNDDYRSAEVMWQDVIEKAPWNAAAYNNLAYAMREAGRPLEEAIRLLERSIALDPNDWHPHKNLGDVQYALGRFDDASVAYNAALTRGPDIAGSFEITYNLALVAIQRGEMTEAFRLLRAAMALDPAHPRPHSTLGAAMLDMGDLAGAREHLETAARLQPTPNVLSNLAVIATADGNLEAAAQYYRAALALEPGYARAAQGLREIEASVER